MTHKLHLVLSEVKGGCYGQNVPSNQQYFVIFTIVSVLWSYEVILDE